MALKSDRLVYEIPNGAIILIINASHLHNVTQFFPMRRYRSFCSYTGPSVKAVDKSHLMNISL